MSRLLSTVLWLLVVEVHRDNNCTFLCAFAARLHPCAVLEAELWGIYNGLKIAWSRGFRKVHVFSDALNAITLRMIVLLLICIYRNRTLVDDIHQIHNRMREVYCVYEDWFLNFLHLFFIIAYWLMYLELCLLEVFSYFLGA